MIQILIYFLKESKSSSKVVQKIFYSFCSQNFFMVTKSIGNIESDAIGSIIATLLVNWFVAPKV